MMMQGLRKASQNWLGKTVVTILFLFLIVSFAIWGIGDIFRGGGPRNVVARIGSTEITVDQLRNAYQNEIQRLTRQERRGITPEAARARGIDRQVLSRLVSEAAFDEEAKRRKLAVSDTLVADSIRHDRVFQSPNGFDRNRFDEFLRFNGLTERAYVEEQRAALRRNHIAEAVVADILAPSAVMDVVHRYASERRTIDYITLPAADVNVPAPDDAALNAYFESRKAAFRAPEYRGALVLALRPSDLAKPTDVTDADVQARYEAVKGERYGTPERRAIQQIVFPNAQEAEAAAARIRAGTDFADVAKERGIADKDLDLGRLTRNEIIDPAVGDAAFALGANAVSAPVAGRFGTVLVRVTAIEPGNVRPLAEVADDLRREIAQVRAAETVQDLHDKIEDQRAAAKPLADVAREFRLSPQAIAAVDRTGRDPAGTVIEAPEREALVTALFNSDIGADNEALRTRDNGYVWFEVTNVTRARERTLAEVRDEVANQWREDEISRRLGEQARALVARLDAGESVAKLAGELGRTEAQAEELAREQEKDGLGRAVIAQAFATPVGKAGNAANGLDRVVFQVVGATLPPLDRTAQDVTILEGRVKATYADDVLATYVVALQKSYGLTINEAALRTVLGGGQ